MSNRLDKDILGTVCYYDVLDYPMTAFEIWKYLIEIKNRDNSYNLENINIGDIVEKLKDDSLKRFIVEKNGIYFLKGREELIQQRIRRDKISILKIKRLRRIALLLRLVPFVRMIAVTGRLAMKNAKIDSDWDVLIALKKGKIWTGRTLVTLVSQLLGKRRHHNKTKDRVCLNYFITTDSLEIRNKDIFSANEYFFCLPIFSLNKCFERFQLKNGWIKEHKPNYYLTGVENLKTIKETIFSRLIRNTLEKIFNWNFLEKYLGKIEYRKIKNNPKTKQSDGLIIADNKVLIFLPEPQGPRVFEKFKGRINRLGI